jgi:heme/copper-type cytochrome/quinol oxidase subunit 2
MQFSHFLVSITIILASANYLAEGQYVQKWNAFKSNWPVLLYVGLFVLHIVGLLWTTDVDFAARDIQIKLPLLALPIIFGTSRKLPSSLFEWILLFFIATSLLSSIVGAVIYFGHTQPGDDYRQMSPYMSHIRLSLMMGVAVISCLYLFIRSRQFEKVKIVLLVVGVWLLAYLFMLRAMSGIVAVFGAFVVMLWVFSSRKALPYAKQIKMGVVVSIVASLVYLTIQVNQFYKFESFDVATADTHTPYGEVYQHQPQLKAVENGHYVYNYIAHNELATTWDSISEVPSNGKDARGQYLHFTLLRYLTSKGLRKDRDGVLALNHLDIWAIENGIANVRYLNSKNINTLVYGYIWETYNYFNGHNPQGNSIGQRFLFWKLGYQIFKENWLIGVGTGDLQLAFNEQYTTLPFEVDEKYQLRAHNQYLTMFVAFGLFGGLYFLITLLSVYTVKQSRQSYLFMGTYVIFLISMLDEDTLETQFGVTFALFFSFLFLYQQPRVEEAEEASIK